MKFIKAGLCGFSIVLFVITMALMGHDKNYSQFDRRVNAVHAGYGITACALGIVVAAAGIALVFLEDIGKMPPVKAAWAAFALIALWFFGGATGIWAQINTDHPDFMTERWKADMAFFIISTFVWLITVAYCIVDVLEGAGCDVMKIPALALLGFSAVLFIITMALAAANRQGRGASVTLGEVSRTFNTSPLWAAFALTGSITGIVMAAAGIGLLMLEMWGKDDIMSRGIRCAWTFVSAFALVMLACMCGVWSYWINDRNSSNVGPGYDYHPYTDYFKAEFAFEIISSIIWIATITVFAAFGAGGTGESK